jgi:hypothetical protein
VRRTQFGPAALNFPPTLAARDGILRHQNHQKKNRNRWRRPSWACRKNRTCLDRPDRGCRVGAKRGGHKRWSVLCVLPTSISRPLLACSMAALFSGSRPRLVGRPLLYSISAFASLGVFLVSLPLFPRFCYILTFPLSSDMIKGNASYCF